MNKKLNKNKGITLIALVITIIVMLILVAVTISMAVNGGLFNFAGKASKETQNAIDAEQELSSGKIKVGDKWYASIDDYLKGKYIGYVPTYSEAEFDEEYLAENATYTSGDYTAVIPKGFKIIPGINNTTTIADGLVIQDKEGNEFVWIPVNVTENDTETGIASFYRSKWEDNARSESLMDSTYYKEPYADGYTGEETDYNKMLASVYHNGGFYIGRYEAGSTTLSKTTEIVVKRDMYPYNYASATTSSNIGQSDAISLSKTMYEGKNVGVTSTLCYGIMWDSMLDFINDDVDVTDDVSWGNCAGNSWKITRTTAKYSTDNGSTWDVISNAENGELEKNSSHSDGPSSILLSTGASDSFAAKNIYDVVGNLLEWTLEVDKWRVVRGRNQSNYSACGRLDPTVHPTSIKGYESGFRVALYVM